MTVNVYIQLASTPCFRYGNPTEEIMNPHLVANLQHYLDVKRVSMNELSRRAGLSQTGVYDIINSRARSPRLETLEKLAEALDITVADLLMEHRRADAANEMLAAFSQLPEHDQERLLQTAQAWLHKPD
jgi:transcriptional regulator with XRE-family HTH domain